MGNIGQCLLHRWFEPKRKVVFNLRWGIEDDSDEEEEIGADGKRKKRVKTDETDDVEPIADDPEDIRAYIKAQLGEPQFDGSSAMKISESHRQSLPKPKKTHS